MTTGFVFDSTARFTRDQQAELAEALGGLLHIVDLVVAVDGEEAPDSHWSAGDICAALSAGRTVTTSMPSPEAFGHAIGELVRQGADAVIVVTLSGKLSGTHQAAVQAGEKAPVDVFVVDSLTASAGLAAASELIRRGAHADPETLAHELDDWFHTSNRTFFVPDSLEYLRRGGRLGAASALLGKALSIVPILSLRGGEVHPIARVRTKSKAVDRLAALVLTSVEEMREFAPDEEVDIVLMHPEDDPKDAGIIMRELEAVLRDRAQAAQFGSLDTAVLSTALTAHVGPGAVGVAVVTRPGSASVDI